MYSAVFNCAMTVRFIEHRMSTLMSRLSIECLQTHEQEHDGLFNATHAANIIKTIIWRHLSIKNSYITSFEHKNNYITSFEHKKAALRTRSLTTNSTNDDGRQQNGTRTKTAAKKERNVWILKSPLQCSIVRKKIVRCVVVQCSAEQCNAVQFSVVQCSVVQCSVVQCSAEQCSVVQCSVVQCSVMQCSVVQCSVVQCSVVQCSVRV